MPIGVLSSYCLFLANHRFMCSFGLLNAYQSGICLEQALVSKEAP